LVLKESLRTRTRIIITGATSLPILVFLGFSVLDLGPMYATDRHRKYYTVKYRRQTDRKTDRRQTASSLNAPPRGREHNKAVVATTIRLHFDCDSVIIRLPFDRNSTALRSLDHLRHDRAAALQPK